jgi:hypothetical protein
MKQRFIIPTLCVLVLTACTGKQKQNSTTESTGNKAVATVTENAKNTNVTPIFPLANQDGSKFLLKIGSNASADNVPDSLKNYKYVLYDGAYYNVDFKGLQQGDEKASNGRDTPYNYDNCRGWYYEMQSGKLQTDTSKYAIFWGNPLLVDEAFKNNTELLKVKKFLADDDPGDLSKAKAKFEKQYGKKATKFKLDALVGDYKYYVMQFETIKNQALGAIALVKSDGKTITKDFPKTWDKISTWREGDEGEFFGYDIMFATVENGKLTLYTYNGGEEGSVCQSYVIQGDTIAKGAVSNYFYHAPD